MTWRVFAASAIGKSHIDAGTPCQDAFASEVVGDTLLATVCDGAGSQELSHIGSQAQSDLIVKALAERLARGERLLALDAGAFLDVVADIVADVRAGLAHMAAAAEVPAGSYAATLVGVAANGDGGWFFHIGDGQGVAQPRDEAAAEVMSLPENGEYANETWFVTSEQWREHLRVTAIAAPLGKVVLMSDGAASFVMGKGNAALYRPFIEPVERFLASASEADGSAALASTIGDARTYRITGDDKTLLIAVWQ